MNPFDTRIATDPAPGASPMPPHTHDMINALSTTSRVSVVPEMPAYPDTQSPVDTGAASTGSPLLSSQALAQIKTVISGTGCNQHTGDRLLDAWTAYCTFAAEYGTLPARLEDISPADLTRFVAHARSVQGDIDALLMMLTMLGSLLLRAGNNPTVLAALMAAVRRMRVKNTSSGKYAYVKKSVAPPVGDV